MMKRGLLTLALGACLGTTGCLTQILLDGQIASTRKASVALNTVPDFEVANTAAFASLATLEGYHYLAPDNANALYLLTRAWTAGSSAFIEDQMEIAEDLYGIDSPEYRYHQSRARAAYERGIHYGTKLIEKKVPGFAKVALEGERREDRLKEWLKGFSDPSDAVNLFWTGYAWIGRTSVQKDEPALVAELWIGVTIVERAVELDPNVESGLAQVVLGSYHARSPGAELDLAKEHFDKAIAATEGKALMPKMQYATRYLCARGDREGFVKTLQEILDAGDTLPEQRLQNTIAKRKANRWMLSKDRARDNCGFDVKDAGAPAPAETPAPAEAPAPAATP
jgi:hypothetical protein